MASGADVAGVRGRPNAPRDYPQSGGLTVVGLLIAFLYAISNIQQRLDDERTQR